MALIEDYVKTDKIIWNSIFHKVWIDESYKLDIALNEIIDFLCEKVSFWYYKDLFDKNPFKPFADFTVSGGSRSADFIDLTEDDLVKIEKCVEYTKNHLIIGFLNDILGLARNNDENRLAAAKHFIEYAKEQLSNREYRNVILNPIERAFALLCQLKRTKEIEGVVEFFLNYSNFANHSIEYKFKVSLIDVFFTHSQKTYGQILSYAENIFEKCHVSSEYISYSIVLAKIILKIYKSMGDRDNKHKWAVVYAENLCKCDFPILDIEKEIDNAIEELDKIGDFERVNKLRVKKKQLNDKFYQGFDMKTMPFMPPKEITESMMAVRNKLIGEFEVLDGLSQFCFFLLQFNAYSIKEIKKQLKQKDESDIIDLVNEIRFDENKEIIYQSATASEKQKIEHETYQLYEIEGLIKYNLLINPFLFYVKFDEELLLLITDIVNHNELVYRNHNVVINSIANGISKKQIRSALAGLLPQFEEGMRNYIEKQGIIPIIRSGGNEIKTSLSEV